MHQPELHHRVQSLEYQVRWYRRLMATLVLGLISAAALGWKQADQQVQDLIRARRILIIDAQGRERMEIAAPIVDPPGMNRAFTNEVGIIIRDETGAERFGMGHSSVNSMQMGFDAPVGAGSPMRDRLALGVNKEGAAWISLINNETGIPVRLVSEANNSGGVEFVGYEKGPEGKPTKAIITRMSADGQRVSEVPMGGN